MSQNSTGKSVFNDWFCLTVIFLISLTVLLPMYFNGIPNGRDLQQHLQFAETYYKAILTGDFFPSWAAADNYRFGSVGIRFYPPIAYYALAFARILTGNWHDAILAIFLFWMFAGCAGVYFWVKEWLSVPQAVFAATLYAVAPYHLSQIYQTWLYAEFAAAGILPFCFLFITRVCRRGKIINVLLFSVSCSLLILTHIPSTITAAAGLAIYALFLIDWRNFKEIFIKLFAALILSLSATSFHWLKILTEINWVRHNDAHYSTGYYDYHQYLFPMFYSATRENYWVRLLWHFDVSTVLTFLLLMPLIVLLTFQFKAKNTENFDRRFFLALAATGIFSLFIMSVPSLFVWESVTFLQKVQFPWRWLSISSVISVVSFTVAIPCFVSFNKNFKKVGFYTILLLMTAILIFNFTQNIIQSEPLSEEQFARKLADSRTESGCPCWWTTWAKDTAFKEREKVSADGRKINITVWNDESREFEVEPGEALNVRIATFYYPFWQAQNNNRLVTIEKDDDGSILIPVESEKSTIKLYFKEPKFLKISLVFSILVWFLLLSTLMLIYGTKKIPTLRAKTEI